MLFILKFLKYIVKNVNMKDFLLHDDFVVNLRQDMENVFNFFSKKLSNFYVDMINIDVIKKTKCVISGKLCNIESVAVVFLKDKRTAVIEVFDILHCLKIISSLRSLGMSIKQEGVKIIVSSDVLTSEKRILLEKEIKKITEHTKIVIRQIRQTFFNKSKLMFKKKLISEDVLLKNEKVIQEITNLFIKNIDVIVKKKLETILHI